MVFDLSRNHHYNMQTEHRTKLYFSTFPKGDHLSLYLSLREDGDNHSTACETIRGELQMASTVRKA